MLKYLLNKIVDLAMTILGTLVAAHLLGEVPPAAPEPPPKQIFAQAQECAAPNGAVVLLVAST